MIVLQVNQLTKSFLADEILSGVKLEVQHRDRVALVGRNGAGKSTLLKIIAGQMSYDSGDIIIPKDIQIGYLEQHAGLNSTLTIWNEMMTIFESLLAQEQLLRSLEQQMADPTVYENPTMYAKVMSEYDHLQHTFKDAGGYQYESDIRSVLHGMQFYSEDYDKPISSLSGGQRTRLALAKLLLSKPDLLILDEPTNHLDIETLSWLESYLKGYEGAILIVSHDRYFLDQVVSIVYEVSRHRVTKYPGNYSAYLDEKAKNYERDVKLYERQQDEKAKLEDFIQKNIARASTTKMAQSRRKMLERTEWMESPDGDEKSASFGFTIERQSGNDVLSVDELTIGYNDRTISSGINLRTFREDRIALVGPNGVGKSTLLKTIVKDLSPLGGSIRYGTNVQIGYYDQEQAKLSSNKSVLKELWDEWPLMNEKDIRTVLGRFLFSGEDVDKAVSSLSGGEKARLALAKLMMQKANFLILDEPTNHLDLDSKEVLENALIDYPGTLLFVSHDRYFINRIATKVVELSGTGSFEYLGDYDYYVEKKQELLELAQMKAASQPQVQQDLPDKTSTSKIDKEAKKRERQIRRTIEDLESKMQETSAIVARLEEALCDSAIFTDHEKISMLQAELATAKEQHELLELEWLELNEELENISM
ncbi:ATP-binding cassette domain-containing protein [Lysinibacillus capsici]|uniref:ATP-binding cassette domain-containing protein n=1 Tax=Lysinibacillus capsici TaxID=2115968 RepID=A0ABY8KE35_9BACI|nr:MULTISPECIES: ATP-binding cassette domain-containing protein [Lysinibacillus]MDP1395969.1 ATP-binding cassette domain-containing protein [Lysinibacillus capsici]MDP1416431.1 ATP-binding cassette domain-containing protein [Lysinibacillus capsici]MDP1432397.1 ATP-binding cassette domain-containing protein [Lysinibacillus capsici]OCX60139.1 multidrug ABC transporter ATP-binding protein [Lysinibacillus sp. AR18-8]WGF36603.1 ATP-binding cassette domain-containing protein [Lysinibacillus capsici]